MQPQSIQLSSVLNFEEYSAAGLSLNDHAADADRRTIDVYTSPACRNGSSLASTRDAAPAWLGTFEAALASGNTVGRPFYAPREAALADIFSGLVTPLVRDIERLLADLPFPADLDALTEDIANALYGKLWSMCGRALVLELAAARHTGLLKGETPEERFWFFASCLRNQHFARGLLLQYPVLVRQATVACTHWHAALSEFAERLAADAGEIARAFFGDDAPGTLTRLHLSAGDSHRQGRSVLIAEFNGGDRKVVYKPRPLTVDRRFTDLVAWLEERGTMPKVTTPRIVERDSYGWSAFVAAAPCARKHDVAEFYRRQGANIALLYFLKGTDLHSENIIAAGAQPVMVDLEALFHPAFDTGARLTATKVAAQTIERSVLAAGILPVRAPRSASDDEWLDMSGMSGEDQREVPFELPMWVDFDTDEMRMQFERTTLDEDDNLPVFDGRRIGPKAYTKEILDGFTQTYGLVLRHRDALLAEDGPLTAFADAEIRVIIRNTARYEQIIHDSYHPDFLRDTVARERFFDTLWEEEAERPYLRRLHRAERRDLWNCDVPVFTMTPAETSLWTSAGEEITAAFGSAPIDDVKARLETAGADDLALQTFLIRAALAEPEHGIARWTLGGENGETMLAADAPLALARRIGEDLLRTAIRHDGGASWIVLEETDNGNATTAAAGGDLYSGLPGIALFLEKLAGETGDARFAQAADEALHELDRMLADEESDELGAYGGASGILYALSRIPGAANRSAAGTALGRIADRGFGEIAETDVISGLSGCVLALLAAHRNGGEDAVLEHAIAAGDKLRVSLAPVLDDEAQIGEEERALPHGLGHGPIGAALAFTRLGQTPGGERFADAAEILTRREFIRMNQTLDAGGDPAATWCNGTSGFLLAAMEIPAIRPEIGGRDLIGRLLSGLLEEEDHTDCLCHGSLGTVLILERAAELGFAEVDAVAERRVQMLTGLAENGIASGTVSGLHAPGLMDGLAGIGLGLLKLHDRDSVPDVLTLA